MCFLKIYSTLTFLSFYNATNCGRAWEYSELWGKIAIMQITKKRKKQKPKPFTMGYVLGRKITENFGSIYGGVERRVNRDLVKRWHFRGNVNDRNRLFMSPLALGRDFIWLDKEDPPNVAMVCLVGHWGSYIQFIRDAKTKQTKNLEERKGWSILLLKLTADPLSRKTGMVPTNFC